MRGDGNGSRILAALLTGCYGRTCGSLAAFVEQERRAYSNREGGQNQAGTCYTPRKGRRRTQDEGQGTNAHECGRTGEEREYGVKNAGHGQGGNEGSEDLGTLVVKSGPIGLELLDALLADLAAVCALSHRHVSDAHNPCAREMDGRTVAVQRVEADKVALARRAVVLAHAEVKELVALAVMRTGKGLRGGANGQRIG